MRGEPAGDRNIGSGNRFVHGVYFQVVRPSHSTEDVGFDYANAGVRLFFCFFKMSVPGRRRSTLSTESIMTVITNLGTSAGLRGSSSRITDGTMCGSLSKAVRKRFMLGHWKLGFGSKCDKRGCTVVGLQNVC